MISARRGEVKQMCSSDTTTACKRVVFTLVGGDISAAWRVKGQHTVCFLVWSQGLKGRMWSSSSLKRAAGGVAERYSRLTGVHPPSVQSALCVCVLHKASTLDSHTLHEAGHTLNTRAD